LLPWENLVLDELRAIHPHPAIHYWRDKSQREIDVVVEHPDGRADAVEAKVSPDDWVSSQPK
jgi:predicted AAA+ superfamily ATPase